jgi:hypothetical protein
MDWFFFLNTHYSYVIMGKRAWYEAGGAKAADTDLPKHPMHISSWEISWG